MSWTSNETLSFDNNGDKDTWNYFNATAPSSTVFYLGTGANTGSVNDSGSPFVAYCFAEKAGYSKFDTYTGNGSSSGPIVNTGFEPAWLIIKRVDSAGSWAMLDNKRTPTNPRNKELFANLSDAENTFTAVNFLTNGFQIINTSNTYNANGGTFIYYAFASDASTAPTLAESFNIQTYTGNGLTQSITGLGFSPSFVWLKRRNGAGNHYLNDTVRGTQSQISSNLTAAETTYSSNITSYDTDGFTLGTSTDNNGSGQTFVAWNWKANLVPTINTNGTIQSVVSASQAAGFSIVKWTTNGSASQFVGHGLSVAPSIIIYKRLDGSQDWFFETDIVDGSYDYLNLNTQGAAQDGGAAWSTRSTSTTISAFTSSNNFDYIAYCFTPISGFSKFGSYSGSASAVTVTTGFQPDWIMIKRTNNSSRWIVLDAKRNFFESYLDPSDTLAEQTDSEIQLSVTSTTFVIPAGPPANSAINVSGSTYIYMAFKENPVQYAIPSGQMGYLVAAGGGGGGWNEGAGGGAGGLRTTYGLTSGGGASAESNLTLTSGTYTITIGGGGIAGTYTPSYASGGDGSVSSITGLVSITTVGGGGGGTGQSGQTPDVGPGRAGGSGGGGSRGPNKPGGAGTSNQGFAGGASNVSNGDSSGGGGGATQAGQTPSGAGGADGGNGLTSAITGSNSGYAGGGGGGSFTGGGPVGVGKHGGGAGVFTGTPNAGVVNTGGGAGGGGGSGADSARIGGVGGSGVVILRMNTSDFSGTTSGSPTISTIGSETILQYLASGSYIHNPSTASGTMNYMVLAGGASGASNGGGGGAGGLRSSWYASGGGAAGETPLTLSSGTYTITIGAGGAAVTTYQDPGNDGTATTISGNATVNTVGGGGGGSNNFNTGRNGGAGGGAGAHPGAAYNGGSGTAGEGFDGGRAGAVNQPYAGAGGGGTGAVGEPNSASAAGAGGDGVSLSITGTLANYGGGGGGTGGTATGGLSGGAGGAGGGADGGAYNTDGSSASANTGSGGGGSGDAKVSGAGGSGKVILRLITSEYSGTTTGSPTVTTVGTETVLTFTGSGTYVHS